MAMNGYNMTLVILTILLTGMLICLHICVSSKHYTLTNLMKSAFYIMLFLTQAVTRSALIL